MMKRPGAPASSPAVAQEPTGTSALLGLVPKLRFPEFRDDWHRRRLEEVAPLQRGFDLTSSEVKQGNVPVVYSNGVQNFHAVGMATAPGLVTGRSGTIGKLHFIEEGAYWPHNTALWVTSFKENWPKFVYYLFASIGIERFASGSGVPTLNRNDVHDFLSGVPASLAEQQKIAECLSTLDELMAAENQKLDALKAHKKGLMQRLFPREGETLPRLRFPEFRDAGAWSKITFGQAATFYNGRAYKQEELLESGKYPVLRVGNFFTSNTWYYSDLDLDETKYCEDGDLLYAWSASFGPRIWRGERSIYHYHIWKVIEQRGIDKQFLFIALENETENMKAKTTNGLGIMHITKGAIESWESAFPTLVEQRKIAGCLMSIDNTISSQIKKIEALKIHKDGLMQQLFPSLDSIQL